MTTIVNNPQPSNNSSGPWGFIIAIIVLAVLAYFGYVYGVPAIQRMQSGTTQINVPSKIDVNVNQTK